MARKIIMLTRYGARGASSRQRMLMFKEPLQRQGLTVEECNFLTDDYLLRLYEDRRMRWSELVGRYAKRIATLLLISRNDVLWIEKEALPWVPAWIERLLIGGRTLIVDFDDAWHLKYKGCEGRWYASLLEQKLEVLARRADTVIVANRELLSWAQHAGCANVAHIPTVVDVDRYCVVDEPATAFTIGWIGTPLNLRYLQRIIGPLQALSRQGARLLLIGAPYDFVLPDIEVENVAWSEETEAVELSRCHVGIMPLDDTPWEKFKSGYKLIQYMAAGRAVVASPIGANIDIVRDGETGFFARSDDEWFTALAKLRDDIELRRRFGLAARRRCAAHFSLRAALAQVMDVVSASQNAMTARLSLVRQTAP